MLDKQSLKNIGKKTLQIIILGIIWFVASFVVGAIIQNIYNGLLSVTFVSFTTYLLYKENILKSAFVPKNSVLPEQLAKFIYRTFWIGIIIGFSFLISTLIVTIFGYLVNLDPCDKNSINHSEKNCAIQSVKDRFYEDSYDYYE